MSKKKVFVSIPMRGRTTEEIRKDMQAIFRAYCNPEEDELIDTLVKASPEETNVKRVGVWYLGRRDVPAFFSSSSSVMKLEYCIGSESPTVRRSNLKLDAMKSLSISFSRTSSRLPLNRRGELNIPRLAKNSG